VALVPPFVFPSPLNLPGLAWPVTKEPFFQTRIRRAASGRELRVTDYVDGLLVRPIWQFTLSYNFLRGPAASVAPNSVALALGPYAGAGHRELGILHGFATNVRGPFFPFFYDDPDDNSVIHEFQALGDGVTTSFQLQRYLADPSGITPGFSEPLTAIRIVGAVYFNDVAQPAATWSVDRSLGTLSFQSAPSNGVTIRADFTYWFRCRFVEDVTSLEEFMYLLSTSGVRFVSLVDDRTSVPL
jgi:uncharacterized protein (TIGR02217 family)